MNCNRIQRDLDALLAGELPERHARYVQAHLESCAACRAEHEQLQKLSALLKQLPAAMDPYPGFEQRVWNGIRRAEREQPVRGWWQRPAWVLSFATATAVLMLAATTWSIHTRAEASARQQLYASLGLNQLDLYPAGSLSASYMRLP